MAIKSLSLLWALKKFILKLRIQYTDTHKRDISHRIYRRNAL